MKVKIKESPKEFKPVKITIETQDEFDILITLTGATNGHVEGAFTGNKRGTVMYNMYSKLDNLKVQNNCVDLEIKVIDDY